MEFDLTGLAKFVDSIDKNNQRAMRSAAQRSLTAIRKEAFAIIRERYSKVRKTEEKSFDFVPAFAKLTDSKRFYSGSNLEIAFRAATRPFNAAYTVVGSPNPRDQRGLKRTGRPAIFKRVAGQKKLVGQGQFLFQKNGTNMLGFKGPNKEGKATIIKETYSSIHQVLMFRENRKRVEDAVTKVVEEVYDKFLG